jgi:acetyltransferase-like isoleucine patch superfamily enzyme
MAARAAASLLGKNDYRTSNAGYGFPAVKIGAMTGSQAPGRSGWEKVSRGLRNPRSTWGTVRALGRGRLFKLWCTLFRPRVQIGRNLILDGKLKIRGPGRVIIGDNVNIGMVVTPYTHSTAAVIRVGDRTFLNGTRFGCKERIDVGARCILAECRVLDYDFHSTDPNHRNDPAYIKSSPVTIGENVWITLQCIVQKGVTIGRNSTITASSVVRADVPPNSIAGGNPAVLLKTITSDESR